jgi:hypothetical protein
MSRPRRGGFWKPEKRWLDEIGAAPKTMCKPSHKKRWRIPPDQKIPARAEVESYWICDVCHPSPEDARPPESFKGGAA